MKTLNTYITEWKANLDTISYIDKKNLQYFVYEIDKPMNIRIMSNYWSEYHKYRNNVYIDGKNIKLDNYGVTYVKFNPGTYYVEIKDINGLKSYNNMFAYCDQLVFVPLFNTSNAISMNYMFENCNKLKQVPLFDTSNVESMFYMFEYCESLEDVPLFNIQKTEIVIMTKMFLGCDSLNKKTKREWSKVYDFEKDDKKI